MAARDGRHSGRYALRQRRTSTAATTDALVHAVKTLEARAESTLLLLWDDLPAWRRDNAFIRSGYRSATRGSYACSLRSLFYLYCAIRPRYASASPADLAVFACFFGGAVVCLGMSATFHALLDHSEEVARWGNKLDYTGIVALIVGSYVPALYYAFRCQPLLLAVYLSLICALGTSCAAVSWIETFRTPAWRPYRAAMFIGLGVSGVVPVVHAVTVHGYRVVDERMSISWVIAHGATYIVGAVLYAVRWPERSFPGAFDIWGSSHQIFHVCVLLAAATHFYGMTKAFDHHHSVMGSQCPVES